MKGDGCQYDSFNLSLDHFMPLPVLPPSFAPLPHNPHHPSSLPLSLPFFSTSISNLTFFSHLCSFFYLNSSPVIFSSFLFSPLLTLSIFFLSFLHPWHPSTSSFPLPLLNLSSSLSSFCCMVDDELGTVFTAAIVVAAAGNREAGRKQQESVSNEERVRERERKWRIMANPSI